MTVFQKLRRGMLPGNCDCDIGDPENGRGWSPRSTLQCLWILVCLGLFTEPASRAQKMNIVTAVKMEADPDHKMVGVPCQINGTRRRYVCVIDSGATNTIVSDRVVKAQGPTTEMTTGNGIVRVHLREVSLTIAEGLELKSKAFVQSMMPQGVDILVGQDVLRQFRFVIFDYENGQVEFQR